MKDLQDGRVMVDPSVRVSLSAQEQKKYLLTDGDILLNRTNSPALVGKAGIFRGAEQAVFASYLVRLGINRELADPDFVIQVLNSEDGQRRIRKLATRAVSQANINPTTFQRYFEIPSLGLHAQHGIRNLLVAVDQAVNLRHVLIQKQLKRVEWFRVRYLTGKIRLPGYSQKWGVFRLSEVLYEHGETKSDSEEVYSVSVHEGLVNQIEHLGRSFAAATTDHYNLVKPGDIVYTKSPTGDFPLGIIKQSKVDKNVIVSPLYGVFTPKTRELGVLLDCYFESPANAFNYLHPIVQRGAKNTISITNKTFLSNSLLLPTDPDEQKALAGFVELAKREIRLLERQVEAYRRQKRGLMQKLLTGEWRIKNQ